MADEMDRLRDALHRETPQPQPDARARALAAARAAFAENSAAAAQGPAAGRRPMSDRAQGARGLRDLAMTIFDRLTTRPALLGTTALATLCVGVVLTQQITDRGFVPVPAGPGVAVAPQTDAIAPEGGRDARPAGSPAGSPAGDEVSDQVGDQAGEQPDGADTRLRAEDAPAGDAIAGDTPAVEAHVDVAPDAVAPIVVAPADSEADPAPALKPAPQSETALPADAGADGTIMGALGRVLGQEKDEGFATGPGSVPGSVPGPVPGSGTASGPSTATVLAEEAAGSAPREPAPAASSGEAFLATAQPPAAAPLAVNRQAASMAASQAASPAMSDDALAGHPAPAEDIVIAAPPADGDRFEGEAPNPLKQVSAEPVSTFSVDVDTASYAWARAALSQGYLPDPASVRTEEFINYFDYAYPAPLTREEPFATSVSVIPTPWNDGTRLMQIGIRGYDIAPADRPPLNLVFLIDTSGSMQDANKLPLLVRSFGLLLDTLTERDSVAIVTYAGSAGTALEPTPASDRARIQSVLDGLMAGGSTAGHAGLQGAYALAGQMAAEGEVTRVILATDGDFNVGIDDPEALTRYIADQRDTGTYLSVLGFGAGNLNDALMQRLAQNGNGAAAYIDTLAEAQKVLVEDVTGSLFPIADDVKIQVEFNPATVAEYRLIGYETRALNREDFNDDTVDAGEIGAGHTVTAIYEITPVGSPAVMVDDLRYQPSAEPAAADPSAADPAAPTADAGAPGEELAFVRLRYKRPGEDESRLIETPVTTDRADVPQSEARFAAAVAAFGEILRGRDLPGGWNLDRVLALASDARGDDPFGYRAEFLQLVRLAKASSGN